MMEVSRNKAKREEGEPKSSKLVDAGEELKEKRDSSLLSPQLGRDLSINCLIRCSRLDYAKLASLNRSFHSLVKSGQLYRVRRKANIVEYLVYYSCSPLEWEAFDPIGGHWLRLPKMPSNECFKSSDKESLAVGTELVVFGRDVMSPIIYKYNISTNIWSSGMSMNTPRCLFASASHHEIAFIAGGCDPLGNILSSAELYNSDTGKFEILPSMNEARKMCSGFFMDNKFYVIGGIGEGDKTQLTCGEEFDPMTRTWHLIPTMVPTRIDGAVNGTSTAIIKAPPLVAVAKNILYAADYEEQVVRRYEKEQNSWAIMGGLPERVATINGWGLAFRACGDSLIFIGGVSGTMIEVYSCVPGQGALQWNLLAFNHSRNFVHNCTVMGC